MDLLSSRPFWPIRDGLPTTFPPLEAAVSCDVLIVGGGISGAFCASQLAGTGLEVVVLDRREAAHGSTAGNTGLMLFELDVPLHRLAEKLGRANAERAYLRCRAAVDAAERLVKREKLACGLVRRPSFYVAAVRSHVPRLRREYEARRAAGLDLEWWPRRRIAATSTLPHAAALMSRGAAQLDPYRLTYDLLLAARRRGIQVHDRTAVTKWEFRRHGVDAWTSRGHRVRAKHLIVASGYEAGQFLPEKVGSLHSTFALATEPVADPVGWPEGQCLIWDTGDPYLYFRLTEEGRVIAGGYDEPFRDPATRDRLLTAKVAALLRRCRQFFPRMPIEMATSWAGTFGVSDDGMPFIGQHPKVPHAWFALGFGGNGTTFAFIAAEIIRAGILGEKDPDAELFGFGRSKSRT